MSDNNSFHHLTHLFNGIIAQIEEDGGEIYDELEEKIDQTLELIKSKTDDIYEYRKSIEERCDNLTARIKELNTSYKRHKKRLETFDNYLLYCMDLLSKAKLKGNYSTLSYRKPSFKVHIIDENKIPTHFIKHKDVFSIDKTAILKQLKAGEKIEGAELIEGSRNIKGVQE